MPKPSSSASAVVVHEDDAPAIPIEQLLERADALFRTAVETCRQHRRYACLVDHGVADPELRAALKLATFCDGLLVEAIRAYVKAGERLPGPDAEAWWHRANALWHAAREYERRHQVSDRTSRMLNAQHDSAMLRELALEYDLEASALLFLQQAIDAYRKCRPEVELH